MYLFLGNGAEAGGSDDGATAESDGASRGQVFGVGQEQERC